MSSRERRGRRRDAEEAEEEAQEEAQVDGSHGDDDGGAEMALFTSPAQVVQAFSTLGSFTELNEDFHRAFHAVQARVPFPSRSFEPFPSRAAVEAGTESEGASSRADDSAKAENDASTEDDEAYTCESCSLLIPYPMYCMGCTTARYDKSSYEEEDWRHDLSAEKPVFRYKHELLGRLKYLDSVQRGANAHNKSPLGTHRQLKKSSRATSSEGQLLRRRIHEIEEHEAEILSCLKNGTANSAEMDAVKDFLSRQASVLASIKAAMTRGQSPVAKGRQRKARAKAANGTRGNAAGEEEEREEEQEEGSDGGDAERAGPTDVDDVKEESEDGSADDDGVDADQDGSDSQQLRRSRRSRVPSKICIENALNVDGPPKRKRAKSLVVDTSRGSVAVVGKKSPRSSATITARSPSANGPPSNSY